MANLDLLQARDRAEERLRCQRQAGDGADVELLLRELCALTDQAARVALEAAGYQRKRSCSALAPSW